MKFQFRRALLAFTAACLVVSLNARAQPRSDFSADRIRDRVVRVIKHFQKYLNIGGLDHDDQITPPRP
jgi:hypothetical protein